MIKEILEEPEVIRKTIVEEKENIRRIASLLRAENYEMTYITGSGTSYHAGLASQYALSSLTDMIVSAIPASEFNRWVPQSLPRKTLLIAISQSGESTDIINAAKAALRRKMSVLAVTNTPGSTLASLADYTIFPRSGREVAVPATKTYVAQLVTIFMLALEIASLKEEHSADIENLRRSLFDVPELIEDIFRSSSGIIRETAKKYKDENLMFILGSGPNYATALEAALKLKETCMVFAEGFATREFLHGPVRLVDERTLVIMICPSDEIDDYINLSSSFKGFGANIISIMEESESSRKSLASIFDDVFYVPPGLPKIFSPIIFVVPIQMFAYYLSIFRGLNPDMPEKLTKVVR
ncbi:MAG: SIS domain-containing protein [Candidatus Bathyarchaeia archaeon]|nr:SIS domain-containing protein [Candidatus Bathyarchaeota archaeon]